MEEAIKKETEYTIAKSIMRNPAILKTEQGDDFEIEEETHKKDAETLSDFMFCEIPTDTLKRLKKKLETADWWNKIEEDKNDQ